MPSDRTPEEKAPLGADLVIPILALGFAVYFFVSIEGLAWEAKANGVLIGTLLVLLVLVQFARVAVQIVRRKANFGFGALLGPRAILVKRVGMLLIAAGFVVAMQWLGLTLALFLAMAAALYLMGVRKRAHLLWTPLISSALAYVMFIVVLDAEFPRGPVEHLLAIVF